MDDSMTVGKKKEGFLGQHMIVLPPDILKNILGNKLICDFYLTAIGYYPRAQYHNRKRESGANEYILLYCTEGKGKVTVDTTKLTLQPNEFVIIPPNVPHHYKSSIQQPWSIYWVHFIGKTSSYLYERYLNDKKPNVQFLPFDEKRVKKFIEIIRLFEHSFEKKTLEFANINLLHWLSTIIYQPKLVFQASEDSVINNSIEYMRQNLNKSLKIEDFAANENLSVSRFSEIFKKETGYPPIHYFIKLKIQKSCQYLYFTDMSIKEICPLIGFTDQYYFSRIFKKTMGVPPSKYKENYKK